MDQYRREAIFEHGLEEFDASREVVADLIKEYEAAEGADYVSDPVD